MADLEKTLARLFQGRKKQLARLAEANAPLRDKLPGVVGKDFGWAASGRAARRVAHAGLASRRRLISKALPRKRGPIVFVGSNAGARFVPFDYSWTTRYGQGVNDTPLMRADADSGGMEVRVETGYGGWVLDGYAAVGIFFRLPSSHFFTVPIFSLANLTVFANPSVYFGWEAFLAPQYFSAHTGGFIGLLVQRYDWTQGLASPLSTGDVAIPGDSIMGRRLAGAQREWLESSVGLRSAVRQFSRRSRPLVCVVGLVRHT